LYLAAYPSIAFSRGWLLINHSSEFLLLVVTNEDNFVDSTL
jgi:hypothetical protein